MFEAPSVFPVASEYQRHLSQDQIKFVHGVHYILLACHADKL